MFGQTAHQWLLEALGMRIKSMILILRNNTGNNFIHLLLLVFLLSLLLSCGLNQLSFESKSKNNAQLHLHSLDRMESNDSIKIYTISIDTMLSKIKFIRFQQYKTNNFMNGQSLIAYDYCETKKECDTTKHEVKKFANRELKHDELTGQIITDDSHWLHPPRSEYFSILEMNAFPYFEKNKKEWYYDLDFGDHWGDLKWITWKGRRTSKTKYNLIDVIDCKIANQISKCYLIKAITKIENLGDTESIFYYTEKYGFIYVHYKTINKKDIILKMI